MENRRRTTDRRLSSERRSIGPRLQDLVGFNYQEALSATWEQQRLQFMVRYLIWALGLTYFNLGGPYPAWLSLPVINLVYLAYVLTISVYLAHARWYPQSVSRWRVAMWTDILFVSFSLVADPSPVPPALLAYIMIVLGNGLRYGMRFFREAIIGSFIAGLLASYLHYADYVHTMNLATIWIILFGSIIILYSYSLMHKIDRVKQELETQGKVDSLTSLLNRRALSEKADVLFKSLERNNKTLAVLFADLNKFKAINDRLGHRTGDQVLAQIASLILHSVRKSDIAARYGGDEFVIVLPDSDLEKATILARRLQENLRSWAQGNQFDLSMSIGIGEAPRHGRDLDAVLENVDKAMYRGKSATAADGIQHVEDNCPISADITPLHALKNRLREFAHARQWEQFHSPKNLAMALIVEAAEMVEHFQWLSEEQSRALPPEKLKEVEQEMADIFIYLIRIADGIGIDLEEAAWRKIELNEEKYPIEKVRGSAKKYSDY